MKQQCHVFMLISAEHEIVNAHNIKYQEIKLFSDSDRPRVFFFLLMNVQISLILGTLTFMHRKNELSLVKKVICLRKNGGKSYFAPIHLYLQ